MDNNSWKTFVCKYVDPIWEAIMFQRKYFGEFFLNHREKAHSLSSKWLVYCFKWNRTFSTRIFPCNNVMNTEIFWISEWQTNSWADKADDAVSKATKNKTAHWSTESSSGQSENWYLLIFIYFHNEKTVNLIQTVEKNTLILFMHNRLDEFLLLLA